MSVQPNVGKLLIMQEEETGKSAGGIIYASAPVEGVKRGTVVAAGPEKIVNGCSVSLNFKEGDKVLFDPLGALKIKLDGSELLLLRVEDIIGKVS